MSKVFLIVSIFLFLVVAIELIFLSQINKIPQLSRKNSSQSQNTKIQLSYSENDFRSSNGEFLKMLNKAKELGYSLNDLTWYLQGAITTKQSMTQQYLITLIAKGRIKNITNHNGGWQIILKGISSPRREEMTFSYKSTDLKTLEIKAKTGEKLTISDLQVDDIVDVTDTFDIKNLKVIKTTFEK